MGGTQAGDHMEEDRPVKPLVSCEVCLPGFCLLSISYTCSEVPQPPSMEGRCPSDGHEWPVLSESRMPLVRRQSSGAGAAPRLLAEFQI